MFAGLKRKIPEKVDIKPKDEPKPRIFGQDAARTALSFWDKKKPLLLCGPSVGKTTLARETLKNYRIWSEDDSPSEAIRVLSTRPPLTGGKWAMLIECAEGLGDEKAKVTKELKSAKIPIIITCDDPWDISLRSLKDSCHVICLKPLDLATATRALLHVAHINNFPMSEDSCHQILEASANNIRQATNAMMFLVATKNRKREGETVIGTVDKTGDMFSEAARICSGQRIDPVTDLDMLTLMLHQNLPLSARNLDSLSSSLRDLTTVDMMKYETLLCEDMAIRSVSAACSGPHTVPRMTFPAYLGKMSSKSSKIPKIRTAGGFVIPTTGPMLTTKTEDMTYAALEDRTSLDSVYPSWTDALERLEVHTARVKAIEKSGKNSKALQKSNLWIEGDSMDIVRSGLFR